MGSECIFRVSFSLWGYVSRVLTFLQGVHQTGMGWPVKISTPHPSSPTGPSTGITHLGGGAGPARICSHWEGEDSDPSPGLGTPLGHSRGPPRAREKLGRRRVCQEPASPVLLFTQPWPQGPCVPWHVTPTPPGKRRPHF